MTTSGPDWDAELTPAPRPEPRATPSDDVTVADLLARLEAIEGRLAEQSVVLEELRAQLALLVAADAERLPGAPGKRRILRASQS